jgi:hypothetical protein
MEAGLFTLKRSALRLEIVDDRHSGSDVKCV